MLDIPGIEYFKAKNTWCGSGNEKRCRIAPGDEFAVSIWPEPLSFDKTSEELIVTVTFPFNAEGLSDAKAYLNKELQ